jgi:hypothetical protein
MRQDNLNFGCYVSCSLDSTAPVFKTFLIIEHPSFVIGWPVAIALTNYKASEFNSLEELEINLQLKFPEASIEDCDEDSILMNKRIKGISQEILKDYVKRNKPLL